MPNASRYIRLTRRLEAGPIPLPGAIEDPVAKTSTVDISVGSLSDTVNPAQDIVLLPYDVITVSKAEKIYVSGALGKTGTVELDEHESLSVLQVLTAMGGLSAEAEPSKAVILRPVLNTARRAAIPIDLTQILATKTNDFPLMPNDILVVPGHKQKKFGDVVWKILPFVTGIIFYIIARYV